MTEFCVTSIDADFGRWDELLKLIQDSFAYMDGIIDPPSSARRLTINALKEKALVETGFAGFVGDVLVGCVFIAEKEDHFYLGKLAVAPAFEGRGIARQLMAKAEQQALARAKPTMELQCVLNSNAITLSSVSLAIAKQPRHATPDLQGRHR